MNAVPVRHCRGYRSATYDQGPHDEPDDAAHFYTHKTQCKRCYLAYAADWRARRERQPRGIEHARSAAPRRGSVLDGAGALRAVLLRAGYTGRCTRPDPSMLAKPADQRKASFRRGFGREGPGAVRGGLCGGSSSDRSSRGRVRHRRDFLRRPRILFGPLCGPPGRRGQARGEFRCTGCVPPGVEKLLGRQFLLHGARVRADALRGAVGAAAGRYVGATLEPVPETRGCYSRRSRDSRLATTNHPSAPPR